MTSSFVFFISVIFIIWFEVVLSRFDGYKTDGAYNIPDSRRIGRVRTTQLEVLEVIIPFPEAFSVTRQTEV